MTAHQLARELLAGPDLPVTFASHGDQVEITEAEESDIGGYYASPSGSHQPGPYIAVS